MFHFIESIIFKANGLHDMFHVNFAVYNKIADAM